MPLSLIREALVKGVLSIVGGVVVFLIGTLLLQLGGLAILLAVFAFALILLTLFVWGLHIRVVTLEEGERAIASFESPRGKERERLRQGLQEQLGEIETFREYDTPPEGEERRRFRVWRRRTMGLLRDAVGPDTELYETFAHELTFGEGFLEPPINFSRYLHDAEGIIRQVLEFELGRD